MLQTHVLSAQCVQFCVHSDSRALCCDECVTHLGMALITPIALTLMFPLCRRRSGVEEEVFVENWRRRIYPPTTLLSGHVTCVGQFWASATPNSHISPVNKHQKMLKVGTNMYKAGKCLKTILHMYISFP